MSKQTGSRVHFTHHPCIVAMPTGETRDAWPARHHGHSNGGDDAYPWWAVCSHAIASWRAQRLPCFTTDLGGVTCRTCQVEARRLAASRTFTDKQLVEVAWLRCCRHHGVPSPLSALETERQLASLESATRTAPLAKLSDILPVLLMPNDLQYKEEELGGDPLRRRVEAVVEQLDDSLREATRPAIAEFLMAADLADEARRMATCGARILGDVERRVIAGEVPVTYGTWSGSVLARSPARQRAHIAAAATHADLWTQDPIDSGEVS